MFKPAGVPLQNLPIIPLEHDELEALRLCDTENLSQEEAGEQIGVSRGTVQRLLATARAKLVGFLLTGSALHLVPIRNHPYSITTQDTLQETLSEDSRMARHRGGGRGKCRRRGGGGRRGR